MTENEVAKIIVDAAFTVHTRLGPGLWSQSMKQSWRMNLEKEGCM